MNAGLSGHVIVVTGGAGRIGQAFCSAIAQAGGTAIVADTAEDKAVRLAAELCNQYGPQAAAALVFDITSAGEIDAAISRLHELYGRIDAVINNAYPRNSGYGAKVEDVTYANFADNVARHAGGYFITAQRFAAYFSKQGRGNIIFMASIYGVVAPRFDIYAATPMTMPVEYAVIKAGLIHLTRYLAQYYKQSGIRVNALSPGGVFADQPAEFVHRYTTYAAGERMLKASDLTGALIFLLSPAAAHITGQNLLVDDGWTL
jgi:NAD(P)-dependent dehydrogenase (short-subunit alcohol dehydrogenase family)